MFPRKVLRTPFLYKTLPAAASLKKFYIVAMQLSEKSEVLIKEKF